MTEQVPSKEMMCYAHEIKEVPRYGIPGTIWDKQHCPYCKIDRLNADMAWIRRRTGFWGEVPKEVPSSDPVSQPSKEPEQC